MNQRPPSPISSAPIEVNLACCMHADNPANDWRYLTSSGIASNLDDSTRAGEIAIRIFRAGTELGLATVAIYAGADRLQPHRCAHTPSDSASQCGKFWCYRWLSFSKPQRVTGQMCCMLFTPTPILLCSAPLHLQPCSDNRQIPLAGSKLMSPFRSAQLSKPLWRLTLTWRVSTFQPGSSIASCLLCAVCRHQPGSVAACKMLYNDMCCLSMAQTYFANSKQSADSSLVCVAAWPPHLGMLSITAGVQAVSLWCRHHLSGQEAGCRCNSSR